MQTIVYHYSKQQAKELDEIVENPLFSEIITYFLENSQEDILLRSLKKQFSTVDYLESFLEKLILLKLIQRKNRRYTLNFPIVNANKTIELSDDIKKIVSKILDENQSIPLEVFLGEWLWKFLFDEDTVYFFGSCVPETFYQKQEIQSSSVSLISILPKNNSSVDLATYFDALVTDKPLAPKYTPLLELVGDVSIEYYLLQIKKIIRKSQVKKVTTIFEQSLLLTGCLSENNSGRYDLAVPVLTKETRDLHTTLNVRHLKQLLCAYWTDITSLEEQVDIKNRLFQAILAYYNWPLQQPITYFIIE